MHCLSYYIVSYTNLPISSSKGKFDKLCHRISSDFHRVHSPYSSVFDMEFNPKYGNTDLLIMLRNHSCHNTNQQRFILCVAEEDKQQNKSRLSSPHD